jgi:FlaA1/EpsC-like NDP-sugar epimerase
MNQEFPDIIFKVIRYFIGDVRDYERLKRAMTGIDCVIHEAVMKHVHIAEYNPDESIKNKERGAENIIKDCLNSNLKWYRLY